MTAAAISASLQRASDLVFRWGGEEFTVLLPNTDPDGAAHVAEYIREKIQSTDLPSVNGMVPPSVTASLGCASVVPDAASTVAELIHHADKAMYDAKESGRNRVCSYIES